jgi:hypothetical protein
MTVSEISVLKGSDGKYHLFNKRKKLKMIARRWSKTFGSCAKMKTLRLHMRKVKQIDRPYIISYIKGLRRLYDSAPTLDAAKIRIARRLEKKHNKGEKAEVYFRRELVYAAV